MKKQILVNLVSNYFLSFFGIVLSFLLIPFLIGKLGKDAYGVTVLAESTVAFFEILTVSVRMALSRHSTFSLSKGDTDSFIQYLSTGRVILYVSASLVFIIGSFVSLHFTQFFHVPARLGLDSQILFFLVSLGFTASIPNTVFWSVLYAKQRFDLINFSMTFGLVMRAIAMFLYYTFAPSVFHTLTAYGFIYLAMILAQNAMIYFAHRAEMPEGLCIRLTYFKKERVKEILSFSMQTSLTRASSLLYQETAQIIINVFWGPAYNAIYSIAVKFPNMMRRIFVEPSWALTPTFTNLAARNEKNHIERLLYMYSKMLSIITFPLSFSLILFAGPLIRSWVGPDFEMAGKLLPYFCVPLFISIPFSLSGCILNAYGKVKIPSFVSICAAFCNLILSLLLGRVLDWKLFGIAVSAIGSSMLLSTLFLPVYTCRVGQLSIRRYWIESFLKPFLLACICMVGGFFALRLDHYAVFFDAGLLATQIGLMIAYYLTAYLILTNKEEKQHIHDVLRMGLEAINRSISKAPTDLETP